MTTGARRPPTGSVPTVLLPSALATLVFGPVVGPTVAVVVLLPVLLVSAAIAFAVVRAGGRGLLVASVLALAVAATSGVVVALGVGGGTGGRAAGVAAALVSLAGANGQILVAAPWPAAAAMPGVALFFLALLLGAAATPGLAVLSAAVVVATALVLLVTGPWTGGADGALASAGTTVGGVLLAGAATVAAGALALGGASSATTLLREPVRLVALDQPQAPDPPASIKDVVPLDQAARWQTVSREDTRLLVTLRPPVTLPRVAWVALDRYDGFGWNPSSIYLETGPRFKDDPVVGSAPAASQVLSVTPGPGLPGPWVPIQTRTVQVVGAPVFAAPGVSSVIALSSPIGVPFEVRSQQVYATPAALAAAGPARLRPFATELLLPGPLPDRIRALVDEAATAGTSPYVRLRALAAELRSARYQALDVRGAGEAVPGRSYAALEQVLDSGVGMQEQYAAVFALGARDWNVPTRLVVGWLPVPVKGEPTEITAAATSVWVEAEFAGIGWVAFQPTPQDRDADRTAVVLPPKPPAVKPTPSASPGASRTPSAAPSPDSAAGAGEAGRGWLGAVAAMIVGLVGWLGFVRWWRSRRRRACERGGSPDRERTAGAWTWGRALLAEAGFRLDPGASADVIVDGTAADDLPPDVAAALRDLAGTVPAALYAPETAAAGTGAAAWAAVDRLDHALSAHRTPRGRLARLLRPMADPGALAAPVDDFPVGAPR